ncbi:hypothetical protein BT93_G0386 [Corymbia citriodora subsp. variegata]|nr:hypothetical protein BT93_G0386 [Corymbia citriodora subsp. variegata]
MAFNRLGGQTHHFNAMTKCHKNCTCRLISPSKLQSICPNLNKMSNQRQQTDQHLNGMTWICSNNLRPIISFIPQEP